jgi:hypothetical protein
MAASATRPRAVSCAGDCPWGSCGGEDDSEVLFHPDAAVTAAIGAVFERFVEFGSVRRVWLWFRSEGLHFPLQTIQLPEIQWVAPTSSFKVPKISAPEQQ